MLKKTISLPFCAFLAALLLCLLILARCHGTNAAAINGTVKENAVPVLMYHHLLKKGENTRYTGNDIVTYTEDFAEQLAWLSRNGFQTITTAQLEAYLYENGSLPPKPVMITFDDGYLSNYVYGYPLLQSYGYTAVIFSVTSKIGENPEEFRPDRIQMLDRETMSRCSPVFEFASHTDNLHKTSAPGHSALTDSGRDVVASDLKKSFAALSGYPNSSLTVFSYPYGFMNETVVQTLKDNGVRLAFRATGGRLTRKSDPYSLPRWPVSYKVSMEKFQSYFVEYFPTISQGTT